MILTCLKGQPIIIDDRPVLQDIGINIAGNNQLRINLTRIDDDGNTVPYSIVIYNYTKPEMNVPNMELSLYARGEEHIRRIPFSVKVSYHFLQKKWKLSGDINRQPLDCNIKSIHDLLPIIDKFKKYFD